MPFTSKPKSFCNFLTDNSVNPVEKTNYNVNQSRNNTPKFNLLPFSFSSGNKNYENPQLMSEKTPKVVMNHFIWEKMKTELQSCSHKLILLQLRTLRNYFESEPHYSPLKKELVRLLYK